MPCSPATSLTARFVVVTAAATFTFRRVVTRARAGNCAVVLAKGVSVRDDDVWEAAEQALQVLSHVHRRG